MSEEQIIPRALIDALDQLRQVQAGDLGMREDQAIPFVRAVIRGCFPDEFELDVLSRVRETIRAANPDGPEYVLESYYRALDAVEAAIREQPIFDHTIPP